jgi:hypothetical protein
MSRSECAPPGSVAMKSGKSGRIASDEMSL